MAMPPFAAMRLCHSCPPRPARGFALVEQIVMLAMVVGLLGAVAMMGSTVYQAKNAAAAAQEILEIQSATRERFAGRQYALTNAEMIEMIPPRIRDVTPGVARLAGGITLRLNTTPGSFFMIQLQNMSKDQCVRILTSIAPRMFTIYRSTPTFVLYLHSEVDGYTPSPVQLDDFCTSSVPMALVMHSL
jgi:Tfp pilus assembly protein PilE